VYLHPRKRSSFHCVSGRNSQQHLCWLCLLASGWWWWRGAQIAWVVRIRPRLHTTRTLHQCGTHPPESSWGPISVTRSPPRSQQTPPRSHLLQHAAQKTRSSRPKECGWCEIQRLQMAKDARIVAWERVVSTSALRATKKIWLACTRACSVKKAHLPHVPPSSHPACTTTARRVCSRWPARLQPTVCDGHSLAAV
jgi:hypothetical protein